MNKCSDCGNGIYEEKRGTQLFTFPDGTVVEYISVWYECPLCNSGCLSREQLDTNMQHMYYARMQQIENRLASLEKSVSELDDRIIMQIRFG